jgi:glutathione S-transferase
MTLKLYCFGESGNSYKAALTLELSGLDWQPVFVDFFSGQARTDAYRSLNIMAEAPVLEQGDFTLSQSGAIQQWAVDQTGKLGGAPEDKYEVLRWVLFDNHKMSSQAGVTRFLMNFLAEDKRPQEAIKFMQAGYLAPLKHWTAIWPSATGSSGKASPSPISPIVAICSTLSPMALSVLIGPILTLGSAGSKPRPVGNTPMI